jgi:Ca2+-transporting ATPase
VLANANSYTGKILVVYDADRVTAFEIKERIDTMVHPKMHIKNDNKVVKVNFRCKKMLCPQELNRSKNTLSDEYYQHSVKAAIHSSYASKPEQLWYTVPVEEVVRNLNSNANAGLSIDESEKRLEKFGLNQFEQKKSESFITMFMHQFDGFIIKLLLGATGVSWILGQAVDAAIILGIIGLEAMLGVWQEYKAEKSLDALKEMSAPSARVLRNGIAAEIPTDRVVPGDILLLEAGDHIAADARLIDGYNMEAVEASLTGEAYPVFKNAKYMPDDAAPLGDRSNMVYMGTSIVRGKGSAIVTATGMSTEMGRIAAMLINTEQEKTPLQKDLDRLAKVIAWGCLGICGIITIGGIIGGQPSLQMLRTGISLAVGAIPEGLTSVLTIALAFGVQRMAKKNAIVKTLPSVETLSCTGVICTDKTGTLTKNEMTVKEIMTFDKNIQITGEGYNIEGEFYLNNTPIVVENHHDLKLLLTASALCNNASIIESDDKNYEIKGDPTEAALLIAAEKAGLQLESFECYQRVHEIPFDSETKRMTAICHDPDGNYYAYVKGAVDSVIHQCSRILTDNAVISLSDSIIEKIMDENEKMASKALRVLAVAYKPIDSSEAECGQDGAEDEMIKQE